MCESYPACVINGAPLVTHDNYISGKSLEVDRRLGVLRDDELEALVEPPVRAAAMQSVALDVV